jgi:hypothetical protein
MDDPMQTLTQYRKQIYTIFHFSEPLTGLEQDTFKFTYK